MDEFKGNSFSDKNSDKTQDTKIKKVISGKATVKKESSGSKFFKAFLADDMNKLKDHIVYDVVIPAIKATIDDIIHNLLYPNDTRNHSSFASPISTNAKTSYGDYYEKKDRYSIQQSRSSNMMDNIFFEFRTDADEVLWNLQNMIEAGYDVTIADVYEAAGVTCHNYMANKYGWTNLSGSSVIKAGKNGYMIRFPEPTALK